MYREVDMNDIIYKFQFNNVNIETRKKYLPEYNDVYDKIKTALQIEKDGYNIYIVDSYSKEKLHNLADYIKDIFKDKGKCHDICYVVKDDDKSPSVLKLNSGMGSKLKKVLDGIQDKYSELIYEFYNGDGDSEKNELVENLQTKRSELITSLVKTAEEQGFDIRLTENGFTFIPMDEGKGMSEKEYDNLQNDRKDEIVTKVNKLKIEAQHILEVIKNDENQEIEKIKAIMKDYLKNKMDDIKTSYRKDFENDAAAYEYLDSVCDEIEKNVIDNYSMNYSEDEESIKEIIERYIINVLVDNKGERSLPVIYEEDPNVNNLLGCIEYENRNGVYSTDTSLIKAGSLLRANDGCLIVRASSLLNNPSAYYYLKKSLMSGEVDFDYNRRYLELISVAGLRPEPIKVREKVIIIGDYETYDLLYNYDEDFKKVFQVRAEYEPIVKLDDDTTNALMFNLYSICKENGLMSLTDDALKEVVKYLSRKAENRNKIYFDCTELDRILMITDVRVRDKNKSVVDGTDISEAVYPREILQKEVLDSYRENKTLINVNGTTVGQINALSVIDTGYMSFGKPLRLTCSCYRGDGNIIDVQKESNLSGNIHNKAISILKGYINALVGGYSKLPVDFHLNFEQLYGKIDGDSASVAEVISMISALSRMPVKQNIAITGSLNQFGEVQPVGGVNEKIEGFFNVCKAVDSVEGKGVLIPNRNKDNLVLSCEVESEIEKGRFHIYTMDKVDDAVELLIGNDKVTMEAVIETINKEIKKYACKETKK